MPRDLVMLRYTGGNEERLAALCRQPEAVETLRDVIGEEEGDIEWCEYPDRPAVIVDTSGPVFVFDSTEMMTLSFWFGIAAEWLRQREEFDHGEDDDDREGD